MALARSTSHGPCRLLTRNWVAPKLAPHTRHAGHTSRIPRQPTCAATSQKGTISEKTGNCRPTMELSACRSRPVTLWSVVSGIPREPKATGAVLPMSASFAASSGLKPSPTSIAPEIATGAPNPAQPSMNAPKQNAMSNA